MSLFPEVRQVLLNGFNFPSAHAANMWRQSPSLTDTCSSSSSLGAHFIRVPRSVNRAVACFCNTLSRHIRHKTTVSMGVYSISTENRYMCIPYTTLDSCTAFLEQRASNNFPDILRNFVRMRQQWFPGRYSYGLGTRLGQTVVRATVLLRRCYALLRRRISTPP